MKKSVALYRDVFLLFSKPRGYKWVGQTSLKTKDNLQLYGVVDLLHDFQLPVPNKRTTECICMYSRDSVKSAMFL